MSDFLKYNAYYKLIVNLGSLNVSNIIKRNEYMKDRATSYALRYGINPNKNYIYFKVEGDGGGDCTNFISQCLLAGGAPMDYDNIRPWWYKKSISNSPDGDRCSLAWSVAHSLYWCLKVRGEKDAKGLKGIEVKNIEELDTGDLIQYENIKGVIYHTGIITSFTYENGKKYPLITQHTKNAVNISYIKPAAVKMHFMKIYIN